MIQKSKLLIFQEELNKKFVDFSKLENVSNEINIDNIGMIDTSYNINILYPLKNLKSLSVNNNYEELKITKSWVMGFNQIYGDVYTVLNIEKIFNLVLYEESDNVYKKINEDESVLYFKSDDDRKFSVIVNQLKLEDISNDAVLFSAKRELGNSMWNYDENLLNMIKEKVNLTVNEQKIIKIMQNNANKNKLTNNEESFSNMFNNVYYQKNNNKIIFEVIVDEILSFASRVSPF